MSRSDDQGCLSLVQRAPEGGEEILTGFTFLPGELEGVVRGLAYQQATVEGHVALRPFRGLIEIDFKSRETGRSNGCTVTVSEFDELLKRLWTGDDRL